MNTSVGMSDSVSVYERAILLYFSANRRSRHSEFISYFCKGKTIREILLKRNTLIQIKRTVSDLLNASPL